MIETFKDIKHKNMIAILMSKKNVITPKAEVNVKLTIVDL